MEVYEYLNDYVAYEVSEGRDYKKTIKKYETCIKEFIEVMEVETIEDIDELTWIDIKTKWINVKRQTLSAQSINLRIVAVKSFFNFLLGSRLIRENVMEYIKKEKVKPKEVDVNINVIKKILDTLNDEYVKDPCYYTSRNRLMITMYLTLGVRNSELINLKMEDINIRKEVNIVGKYGKQRTLVLPDKVYKMYIEYLTTYRTEMPDNGYIFTTYRGNRCNNNVPNEMFKKVLNLAGVSSQLTIHSLRHIFATTALETSGDIEAVSKVLGHVNSKITSSTYINETNDYKAKIINNNKLLEII